jgi:hypothetical protein
MTLDQIIRELNLTVLTPPVDFAAITPQGGYASDLLSCVMAGAVRQGIWVTLQAHGNIVAVAALLDLVAIIISEGAMPDPATIARATDEGITLLSTPLPTFSVVGKLWEMGLRANT